MARKQTSSDRSASTLALLRRYESRNVTYIDPAGNWPIVWKKARGNYVWDANGRRYLDLTAAFGVAAAGHANPRVVKAARRQAGELLHAMGDVHPHAAKAQLARKLSEVTFERWTSLRSSRSEGGPGLGVVEGKTIFCNSGFEAVEAALKTALLATGRAGVVAFEGGYHGLGYGSLNVTHRAHFRAPFSSQLAAFGAFIPYPSSQEDLATALDRIQRLMRKKTIGAILVEPVQARGGMRVPPAGLLPGLRTLCDAHGTLLVLDEVYTGFGRAGRWFACEHSSTLPDLICLGKALTGGFPLSACVGRADLMDRAWPVSTGEAIHTSTYLGHPVGCAMALAQIEEIQRRNLVERSDRLGAILLSQLERLESPGLKLRARGCGLMAGLELLDSEGHPASARAFSLIQGMLEKGFILLPEGEHGNVLGFTPPLTITRKEITCAIETLKKLLTQTGVNGGPAQTLSAGLSRKDRWRISFRSRIK